VTVGTVEVGFRILSLSSVSRGELWKSASNCPNSPGSAGSTPRNMAKLEHTGTLPRRAFSADKGQDSAGHVRGASSRAYSAGNERDTAGRRLDESEG